jgi:Methylamine utilisation protein MauE
MLDPVIAILLMLGGAALFGAAAVHKLRAHAAFAQALREYRILPSGFVGWASVVLPAAELIVAPALLWNRTRPLGALSAAVLLLIYGSGIAVNLLRGRRDLDCGCGGSRKVIGGWMVARNAILAAAMLALLLPVKERALVLGDFTTIGAGFTVAVLLYASADLLLSRPAPRELIIPERS